MKRNPSQGVDPSEKTRGPVPTSASMFSLPLALRRIAERAGYKIDFDDLCAAMGLSWMVTAVPGEPDVANWPLYARDAFLVEAGRLFGLEIRDVHPPEAARGLDQVTEFAQHFDASYRPLVHRALEHGQPVLAWRGWPGEHRLLWGEITDACNEGIGLRGVVHTLATYDAKRETELTLEAPPVQLYVVETITPTTPDPSDLLDCALDSMRRVLTNSLEKRFGVLTGTAAYDAWIERLRTDAEAVSGSMSWSRHQRLARCLSEAYRSGLRFLERLLPNTEAHQRERLTPLVSAVRSLFEAFESAARSGSRQDPGSAMADLARAKATTVALVEATVRRQSTTGA